MDFVKIIAAIEANKASDLEVIFSELGISEHYEKRSKKEHIQYFEDLKYKSEEAEGTEVVSEAAAKEDLAPVKEEKIAKKQDIERLIEICKMNLNNANRDKQTVMFAMIDQYEALLKTL